MAFIDPNLIQKYLTISADIIKGKLLSTVGDQVNDKRQKSNIILLDAIDPAQPPALPGIPLSRDLKPPEAMLTVSRQHELMNPTCLPSLSSSVEVFASEQALPLPFTGQTSPNVTFPVDHRFDFDISFLIPFDNKFYRFKAEEINSNIQFANYFSFVDFSITNTAKDIFTSRSTFQIELKIAFTDLNLLLEGIIPAVNIEDEKDVKNFSLINLIYRFASPAPVPPVGAGAAASSARDSDGVYIITELSPKEDYAYYYQSLIADLNPGWNPKTGKPLLTRTFHCTYHKHEIAMGGNMSEKDLLSGITPPKGNMLTINLVSYEADSSRKDFVSPTTVSQPDNVYDLLYRFGDIDAFNIGLKSLLQNNDEMDTLGVSNKVSRTSGFGTIKNIQKLLKEIDVLNNLIYQNQSILSCISIYSDAKKAGRVTAENPQFERAIGLAGKITVAETAENTKKEIEKLKNEINLIKFSINKSLAWYILSFCNIYKLTVPYDSLQTFDDTEFIKSFSKNFSGKEFLTSTGTGAAYGAYGGWAGAGVGAASSAAFYAVGVAIKSAFEKEIISRNLDFLAVRNTVQSFGTVSPGITFAEKIKNDIKSVRLVIGDVTGKKVVVKGLGGNKAITEDEFIKLESERAKKIINGEKDSFTATERQVAAVYAAAGLASDVDGKAASAYLGNAEEGATPNAAANIEIQKTGATGNVDIQFIIFGELLNILSDPNTFILLGGKPIPKEEQVIAGPPPPFAAAPPSTTIISEYLDFYHYPINLQKFYNFLHSNILKRPEPQYSMEVFIKDIFEQLIRQPLMDGQKNIDETFKKLAPTYLVAATTTHYNCRAFDYFSEKVAATGKKKLNFVNLLRDSDFFEFKKNFTKSKFLDGPLKPSSAPPPNFVGPPSPLVLKKVITFFTDEDIKFHDFYQAFDNDANFGANSTLQWGPIGSRKIGGTRGPDFVGRYDNQKFEEFINQRYFMPCLSPRFKGYPSALLKSKNITFSRIDNPGFTTGNIIDQKSFLRLPYNLSADFFPHLSFFLDVGNHIFIQPSQKHDFNKETSVFNNSANLKSQFGMTGLYVINKTSFSYKWPLKDESGNSKKEIEFSRPENKYSISAILVSYGDSFTTVNQGTGSNSAICNDPSILSLRPASP